MKKEEDELTLPYLVYRTWRNYYVKLLDAYESYQLEDYALTRRQLNQAKKWLIDSKKILLQRGMSVDDSWIDELDAMILHNMEFVYCLIKGDHKYLYTSMGLALDMTKVHKEWAEKDL